MKMFNMFNEVHLLYDRGAHIEDLKNTAYEDLQDIEHKFGHTIKHIQQQWDRQRNIQLSVMESDNQREILALVEELVLLEDKHREAQCMIIIPIPFMQAILILF
jgi:hypothetical protein